MTILVELKTLNFIIFFSPELTKLWNICPNNLDACKDRDFLPSLDDYFADAVTQVESACPPTKDEDNLLKDSNFGMCLVA